MSTTSRKRSLGRHFLGKLGDWLDPAAPPDKPGKGAIDSMLVTNAFLIRSTDVLAKVCGALRYLEKQHKYLLQAKSLRTAFAAKYITEAGQVLSDSQTAIALAIQFELFPTSHQQQHAKERLDKPIYRMARFKIATGFVGTPIIGHALTKARKAQLFYRMLLNEKSPSWLYPVTMSATTIWERRDSMLPDGSINPGEMTSFNHYALGSVADWMHGVIGGLKPLEARWKRFLVQPIPRGKIAFAKTTFCSPYGNVLSDWKIEDGQFKMVVQIPPNTTADIVLPGTEKMSSVGLGTHGFWVPYVEPKRPSLPPLQVLAPEDVDTDSLIP